jgi:hypothetical protein
MGLRQGKLVFQTNSIKTPHSWQLRFHGHARATVYEAVVASQCKYRDPGSLGAIFT